jgi:hypothetical protein
MKKNGPTKNSPERRDKIGFLEIVRAHLSLILLVHRNLGAVRITAAYLFATFAMLSLLFTIRVPVTSDFLPTTGEAKAKSRAISGFMMISNILVYGMIMNWRKAGAIRTAIRITLIGLVFYLDMFLVRIVYILIREGTLL